MKRLLTLALCLGLANAAKIAAAHGGRIDAANLPGGGARFALHLPTATQRAQEL